MKNNIGQISVEFNHTAVKLFQFLYGEYDNTIETTKDTMDEHSFLNLRSQYINTLQQQLNDAALSLLEKYKVAIDDVEHFRLLVMEQIKFYLREFNSKLGLI